MNEIFKFDVRIYYEDTDFSGNVYHGSYVKFFERARTEWLRHLGIHHFELAEKGLAFAVSKMEINFLKTAKIDDILEISTKLTSVSGARITLEQEIFCKSEKITSANITVAIINNKGRAIRLPDEFKVLFTIKSNKN